MKKWHTKTIGDCDQWRDIYEEGNPKPIAPPIMFDAANALVAAHNGEQEVERDWKNALIVAIDREIHKVWPSIHNYKWPDAVLTDAIAKAVDATPTPQGQSRSETGATESDEALELARVALEHCRSRPHEHNPPPSFTITRCEVIDRALTAITRANKARDEQSAPAAAQIGGSVGDYCNAPFKVAPSPAQEKQVEASVEEEWVKWWKQNGYGIGICEHPCKNAFKAAFALATVSSPDSFATEKLRMWQSASSPSEDTKRLDWWFEHRDHNLFGGSVKWQVINGFGKVVGLGLDPRAATDAAMSSPVSHEAEAKSASATPKENQ